MCDRDTISKDNTFDDDEKFERYDLPLDELQRFPAPHGGFNPNFQPPKFPGNNNPHNGNNNNYNNWNNNNSGGNNHGPNVNPSQLGAPPNYVPTKNSQGVQSLNGYDNNGPQSKLVSQNSIKFCLFKFTYIWERNGRAYWAFLLNVDRVSVSGLRWLGWNWVYFGVDLRQIDSFVCYRTNCESCSTDDLYRCSSENSFKNLKKLYTNSETRESVSKTLVSLDIPETKDDFLVKNIGIVDGEKIESTIPCIKGRNTQYAINLEVTYPENLDENIKDKIIEYANDASKETATIINSTRGNEHSLNPLETFNNSTKLISKALSNFSSEFNSMLRSPEITKDIARSITYTITQCKVTDNWKTKL